MPMSKYRKILLAVTRGGGNEPDGHRGIAAREQEGRVSGRQGGTGALTHVRPGKRIAPPRQPCRAGRPGPEYPSVIRTCPRQEEAQGDGRRSRRQDDGRHARHPPRVPLHGRGPVRPGVEPVFEEMRAQTVAALPARWLPHHLEAPQWARYCTRVQGRWVRVMHAQDQLLRLLEEHRIPCVILKGAAVAMYYPHPSLHSMGDVDFLVKRSDVERAAALLEGNGYAPAREKGSVGHHYCYARDGIHFELRRRIPIVSESNERLIRLFEGGIDDREWHTTEGYRFPTLPKPLNGLVLIFHIDQHLREGLGLRQIIDWMMYVSELSDEEWEALVPLLRATGVKKLAVTVVAMCARHLGLQKRLPETVAADPAVCDALLSHVLEKGNFGRKAGLDGRMSSFTLSATGASGLFMRLQDGGLRQWDAAKRHRVLRPFAWLYQGVRILSILIRNRKTPKDVLGQSRHGMQQRRLLEVLGLQPNKTIE